jgi:hypothetical protein
MAIAEPACYRRRCRHLRIEQPDGTEATERVACDALPQGIPDDIFSGLATHDTVRPGQVGFTVFSAEEVQGTRGTGRRRAAP